MNSTHNPQPKPEAGKSFGESLGSHYIPLMAIPSEVHEAAQTLHIYFEKQGMREWEFSAVADRRLVAKLEREADELLSERDTWQEKAEKLARLVENHFGEDFGEFSNRNDPIDGAIDFLSNVRDHRCSPDASATTK